MKYLLSCIVVILFINHTIAQDKGAFTDYNNTFYGKVLNKLDGSKANTRRQFKSITVPADAPKRVSEFKTVWCGEPLSQGRTGTCWCYSTSSFYESEIFRLTKKKIKLSELYTVYFEYLSKAEEFINTKGESFFGEGSETNAVQRQMKKHGLVPFEAYDGNAKKTAYPDHANMFNVLSSVLKGYKEQNEWNKDIILTNIKEVLDKYLGTPPTEFTYEGKKMTPLQFMKDIAQINPDDYVDFMSLMQEQYWRKTEYKVPDNYWRSREYNNVPLDDFMATIKLALKQGYSMSIGGDVSGPGYLPLKDLAFIPSFDIPSNMIDENARQLRFSNGATTDDHAIHLIGYKEGKDGQWWFLIKDSGSSSRNGYNEGYSFYSEDYIKLKMMSFTVHKDAVKEILSKIKPYE